MSDKNRFNGDLQEDVCYHVYNRVNDRELLFNSDKDSHIFLSKYDEYLSPYLDTFSWTLLPDHFHFLNRVKARDELLRNLHEKEALYVEDRKYLLSTGDCSTMIENAFRRMFISYTMRFNNRYQRKGNLFHRPFKRLGIEKVNMREAIIYIHANSVKHRAASDFTDYQWSSWQSLLSGAPSKLKRQEVMDVFGGSKEFVDAHKMHREFHFRSDFSIED